MKVYTQRLTKGADLYKSIFDFCKNNSIKAGVILSGVGCVTTAKMRDASGVNIQTLNEKLEIVSLNGTVSENRLHIHIALSKEDLSTVGGHLVEGTIINTTCELAILSLDNCVFDKEFDEATGYNELKIISK